MGIVFCLLAQVAIVSLWPLEDEEGEEGEKKDEDGLKAEQGDRGAGLGLFRRDSALVPQGVNEEFKGKPVRVVEGARFAAKDGGRGEGEPVETGTSTVPYFPRTIYLPTGSGAAQEDYTLLGLGIRSVSFLGVQVYVAGLYVASSSLPGLQADLVKAVNPIASALIPGEKEQLRDGLLDGEKSYEIWDTLLKEKGSDVKSAWRIVPVRNTDFGHLRDGWVRGITSKTQAASASKKNEQFSDESFGLAMRDFQTLFTGKGRAPKGSVVLLTRDVDGRLGILFQEKDGQDQMLDFGVIPDERISRLIWLGYLGGKKVSSDGARNDVVKGIMELVERPIGSIETKVS